LEKKHLNVLGTIGGGNHFAEFQEVEEVLDVETFTSLELD
jgi:RNA-splicing ligase RtcB